MQSKEKSPNRTHSNHSTFKKKELKKKMSQCLHICQCGREFLSFPAVYSHAKTKHNFKISSRLGDQGRKIVEKQSQVKIYYQINNCELLQEKSILSEEQNRNLVQLKPKQTSSKFNFINKIRKLETFDNKKNIYAVMVQFLNESSHQYTLQAMNFTAETLDLLTTCINQHYMHYDNSRIYPDYCSQHTPETIPYYFNFFMVWYLPSKEKQINQNPQKLEAFLKIFFLWLKSNSYTNLGDESLNDQDGMSFWKVFFVKNKNLFPEEKEQTVTKKQQIGESDSQAKYRY